MKIAIDVIDDMILETILMQDCVDEGVPRTIIQEKRKMLEWAKERIKRETGLISVKDDIPELGVPVITLDIYGTFAVMKRNKIDGWSQPGFGVSLDSITHWMPLPLPPNE